MLLIHDINEAVAIASTKRTRLILMSDRHVEELPYPALNLNQQLSAELLETPQNVRAGLLTNLLPALLKKSAADPLILDGLEILFDRSLAVDPIRLLEACSRDKTILACWPGSINHAGLSYAIPSHPEYRIYKASDWRDVIYLDTDTQRLH